MRKTLSKRHGTFRGFCIVPKRDFGADGFLVKGRLVTRGFVVVKDHCNAMPGATWFTSVAEAKEAIDVLLAVDQDADLFWEILQPFADWPGAKRGRSAAPDSSVSCGRFSARWVGGRVVSTKIAPRAIEPAQFLGLRDLLKRRPELGVVVFSLGLTLRGKSELAVG